MCQISRLNISSDFHTLRRMKKITKLQMTWLTYICLNYFMEKESFLGPNSSLTRMKESFCSLFQCNVIKQFYFVQLSGSTGSQNQQGKSHMKINVHKSYTEQNDYKKGRTLWKKKNKQIKKKSIIIFINENIIQLYLYGTWTLICS